VGGGARRRRPRHLRRRRLLTRSAPLLLIAALALGGGIVLATSGGGEERATVTRYVDAWVRSDYGTMYSLLTPASKVQLSEARFATVYRQTASTATLLSLTVRRVGGRRGDVIPVRMRARTRLFGTLVETLQVPLAGSGADARVRFSEILTFPGLRPGERLTSRLRMPARATLLASDGTPLAQGPTRSSPIPGVAAGIVGVLGAIPAGQTNRYAAQGYPAETKVGLDGLELIFQRQLAGTAGGSLLAGRRVLSRRRQVAGQTVRTTISPPIEQALISAIAGRYAGMVALDPRSGAIRGVAGVAFSAVQPPGSTMKIVTSTAALEAGIVKLSDSFPIATSATIDGYTLHNAGNEACGGTLLNAFAVSCNSVFAPLGVKVGGARLVATSERYGFNRTPPFPDVTESTIPAAAMIGSALAVGSSAIGQGKVQASTLEMTDVAATIAMRGRRPIPKLVTEQAPAFVPVTSPRVAGLIQRMMLAVVSYGTGTAAQIPGVQVAGKTGTAELVDTSSPGASSPKNTDSWFVGYAPAQAPRIVVGALFPGQGAGGATAAPAVHDVLAAALASGH
jgi:cell division protein FtsI/penicillin-binding protein 2